MNERYIRNIGALTEEECLRLLGKKIFVAGCGGLGGHVIDMLLRVGVGEIRCADGDTFEISNLNRQLLCTEESLGLNKALAAREYAKCVNSSVALHAFPCFVTPDNAEAMIAGCDIVVDALDTIAGRKELKKICDKLSLPYVYGAVQNWLAQAALSLPGDHLLELLYPGDDAPNADKSILSCTSALCASLETSLCIRYLCHREVETGKLFYFSLEDFQTISFTASK